MHLEVEYEMNLVITLKTTWTTALTQVGVALS